MPRRLSSHGPSGQRGFGWRPARIVAVMLVVLLLDCPLGVCADEPFTPAKNWQLSFWTNEGFRQMIARGTEATLFSSNEIQVIDLNLTVYSGDAANHIDTILLSPSATFLPDAKIARGEKSVRYVRYTGENENIDASGTRWVYRHDAKKISLDGDVRVTFSAELKNLLQ